MNKISFIIPTYNAENYLEKCLMSIHRQHYCKDKIEILVIDGGSKDNTCEIGRKFDAKILYNSKRLAEYGVQLGIKNATGDLFVIFAADNELVGNNWIQKITSIFNNDKEVSAAWGRLISGREDALLNKYFELIQSDPLNWFINRNLNKYKKRSKYYSKDYYKFSVDPKMPLVWGANGIAYRAERIKEIWNQREYLGDNDAFQCMIEQGNNQVVYFNCPFIYHHHVAKLRDWVRKWRRNFNQHLLDKYSTRNMRWVFTKGFKIKLCFWIIYSVIPVFSFSHSIYLACKEKKIYWLYHSIVSFIQCFVYVSLVFFSKKGIRFVKEKC